MGTSSRSNFPPSSAFGMSDALTSAAEEAALSSLEDSPSPEGVPPSTLLSVRKALAAAIANASAVGLIPHEVSRAGEAARKALVAARAAEVARLAAEHNASAGRGGPRLLPLSVELPAAIVNKAYSDRVRPVLSFAARGGA